MKRISFYRSNITPACANILFMYIKGENYTVKKSIKYSNIITEG